MKATHTRSVNPNSIRMHSEQSDFYGYRTPYIAQLFEAVCHELDITKQSTVLDMGCGRGEVAGFLAGHAGQVHAIDGSPEMIALASQKSNIAYQVVDLNTTSPSIEAAADHMFFGRSIHWFPGATLRRLSTDLLPAGGRVVVCSTQWTPVGEWGQKYLEIKNRFAPRAAGLNLDFSGQSNLGDAGFVPVKRWEAQATMQATARFMVGHTYSTTYGSRLEALLKNAADFEAQVQQALMHYEAQQQLTWKINSWALAYART